MTLERLVPSLDLCQQLKVAGFPQDTAMVWVPVREMDDAGPNDDTWIISARVNMLDDGGDPMYTLVAAPTAGELEEWLMDKGYSVGMHLAYDPYITFGVKRGVAGILVQISGYSIQSTGYGSAKPNLPSALAALVLEVAG